LIKPAEDNIVYKRQYIGAEKSKIVFLHIPKTGGTTLTALLEKTVGKDALCPERFNSLPLRQAGYLASYSVFSGHFDRLSVRVIPGPTKVITVLRRPRDRIISTYRFWRAHPREQAVAQKLAHVLMAIDNDLLQFLKKIQKFSIADVDNMYARAFGAYLPLPGDPAETRRATVDDLGGGEQLTANAIAFLSECAAVGILERFSETISALFSAVGLPEPKGEATPRLMGTQELAGRFNTTSRINDIVLDPETEAELQKLTQYDDIIYKHAGRLLDKAAESPRRPA
jgi:hypothetical protein